MKIIGIVSESGFKKIAISFVIRRLTLAIWSDTEIQAYQADTLVNFILGLKWLEFMIVVTGVFCTGFVQVKMPNIIGLIKVLLVQINGFCLFELLILF